MLSKQSVYEKNNCLTIALIRYEKKLLLPMLIETKRV